MHERLLTLGTLAALAAITSDARADGSFYAGASIGGATLEGDLGPSAFNAVNNFDEDDTAVEIFGGYTFDLPLPVDISIEAGYVDFGEPELEFLTPEIVLETSGFNVWGVAGFDAGPVTLYGKLGLLAWEVEASSQGLGSVSDDGTDLGYGLGVATGLGPVELRIEFEAWDLDDTDLSMLSFGAAYRF